MSLYQMCILMLFNELETLGLDAIRAATEIPEMEFKRHLLSLCTPKLKILRKHSKGKVRSCSVECGCEMCQKLLLMASSITLPLYLRMISFAHDAGHRGGRPWVRSSRQR